MTVETCNQDPKEQLGFILVSTYWLLNLEDCVISYISYFPTCFWWAEGCDVPGIFHAGIPFGSFYNQPRFTALLLVFWLCFGLF